MEQLTVEQLEAQKRNIEEQIASVRETQKQQAIALIKDLVVGAEIKAAVLTAVRDQVWDVVRGYQIERLVRERVNGLAGTVIDGLVAEALRDSDNLKELVEESLKRKIADKLQKERAKQAKAGA